VIVELLAATTMLQYAELLLELLLLLPTRLHRGFCSL
jgi:hypothetical protein